MINIKDSLVLSDNCKYVVVKDDKLCSILLPLFIKSSKDALHE